MPRFIRYFSVFLVLVAPIFNHAHSEGSITYSKLNIEKKEMWRRILLQENASFRPKNADYYLSNTLTPDLAQEFDLVEQYLHGKRTYSGQPNTAPWCRFPARFAFASRVLDDKLIAPEAFRPCNLALPTLDENLKAYLIKTLEPQDTGQALFHVALIIEGKRFYNASMMSINIGFGQNPRDGLLNTQSVRNNEALMLASAFFSEGRATIKQNFIPIVTIQKAAGEQIYRVNMPPEQIYMLSLLAYETTHAQLPYSLLKGNCHTYLEAIFSAVLPEFQTKKRWFFDYFPAFMEAVNQGAFNPQALIFEPHRYRELPLAELKRLAKHLNWREYQILQQFVYQKILPGDMSSREYSHTLRRALAKVAELFPNRLKTTPDLLALRDEYLAETETQLTSHAPVEQANNPQDVPLFNSPYPSALRIRASDIDGDGRLQLELDIFNTLADELPATKPYGFFLGKLNLQASQTGLAFDHFLIAQENKVGDGCCGDALYKLGFKKLNGIALDIVNYPEHITVPEWKFKPQLELSMRKGIGTISNNGFSLQVLPEASFLTYGEFIDLSITNRISWSNDVFAVSASQLVRVYGPEERRSRPNQTLNIEYKLSENSHLEFACQSLRGSKTIVEAGYVFAF